MYQQHLVDTPIYAVRALIACNAGIGLIQGYPTNHPEISD